MEDLCIFERNKSLPEKSNIKLFGRHHHLAAEQVATNFLQAQQSAANEFCILVRLFSASLRSFYM